MIKYELVGGKEDNGNGDNDITDGGTDTDNKVAKMLLIVGVFIIVGGVLSGLILAGDQEGYGDFSWAIFLISTISGVISGMIFVGLGEVIKLLDKINTKIVGLDSSAEISEDKKDIV